MPVSLEIKRVLLSRKTITLICILLLLNSIFFFYQCNGLKTNTLTGEELKLYTEDFDASVEAVLENADKMLGNPLFSDSSSFVYKNLKVTKDDYATLTDIAPVFGENRGIMTVLGYRLTGLFMLLTGIYIVMSFTLEQKSGLFLLVRCTTKGRFPLTLTRLLTLFIGVSVSGILFFSSTAVISGIIFPGSDLSRPVQSVPELSGIISHTSIGGYMAISLIKKTAACILCCLILYFLMSVIRSSLSVVIFVAFGILEIVLYAALLPTDSLCALKYLNLYTVIFNGTDYGHYLNLNIFGRPVGINTGVTVLLLSGLTVFSALCLFRYSFAYHVQNASGNRFLERAGAFISRHKPAYPSFLWEMKKLLISQKALVILILVFFVAFTSSTDMNYLDSRSPRLLRWYQTFEGPADDDKLAAIDAKNDAMNKKLERLKASLERQYEILIEYSQKGYDTTGVSMNIMQLKDAIYEYEHDLAAIGIIRARAYEGLKLYHDKGILIMLSDTTGYDTLLDHDYLTTRQNYLYILIAVILMFSGILACEKISHMETTLRTLYKGGKKLLAYKLLLVAVMSMSCSTVIHLIQFFAINSRLPLENFDYPVQSISCMTGFPFEWSTGFYLVMLYVFRALTAFALSLSVMFISHKSKSRISAIAFGVFFLVIPLILL